MNAYPRLNRLFAPDGKCLNIAVDHGFFNEYGFLEGIEDQPRAVRVLVEAGPDAVQLPVGSAPILQALPGKNKPALVMRVDAANVYGNDLPRHLFNHVIEGAAEKAVVLDAACVCVNLLLLPDQPELHGACVANISRLRAACEHYGMPMMVEPLVFRPNQEAGGYMVDGDVTKIMPLVRQAVELGADLLKADPTDNPDDYHRVVGVAAGRPVLVRGGGRVTDEELLRRTHALMDQGVSGFVYGRNVVQHSNPSGMVRALMAILHERASAEQALRFIS
jgi:fructose-bisphosphate aldolase, class I